MGHLSNEDTVRSPNHIELCTNLRTSELGTPLYARQPVGLKVSSTERLQCNYY